ncbi:hypothetical protein O181_070825 [Austropuccinia psidii MF-1]|uniref:Uncharacterized protein n=1 Tax=Austropuccinia psidii MF-1 TaxID=1389203 RepID=A0A9Q3F5L7_9BASI|nr:hypothetical protein [Austropuccinia psidii MF-1]
MWLQTSQYAEQTQKQFSELEASHERMKQLTASMHQIVKTLQEGHAQLSKACEETNKRLNIIFEEQQHSRRDRDCLYQDINKFLNVYHNMKPQPQGHVMDNPYPQMTPNQMPCWTTRQDLYHNTSIQMSQYSEQTQKEFAELEASHERMKQLTASMHQIVKTLQEGHVQLRKASEETNKRLNIIFEEQHHSRRDRDCLYQDINKFLNFYHNMKPQPKGHVQTRCHVGQQGKICITIPVWR